MAQHVCLEVETMITVCNHAKFVDRTVSCHWNCPKRGRLFDCVADMFNQTPSQPLWEDFSQSAIITRRLLVYKYPSLYIVRCSFIRL